MDRAVCMCIVVGQSAATGEGVTGERDLRNGLTQDGGDSVLHRFKDHLRPGERVLRALSRRHVPRQGAGLHQDIDLEGALCLFQEKVPHFQERVRGRAVVDFGCGRGVEAVALALAGAARVLGVDTDTVALEKARELAHSHGVQDRITFVEQSRPQDEGGFDLVLSQNSMEHFPHPEDILALMRRLVRPQGEMVITFGPPWFAPYGSHMRFFTPVPWVNLLFSEQTVMRVRSRYRDDGARSYAEVRNGLNQMSVARFERLIASLGGQVVELRYDGVLGADKLCSLPLARELFTNHVTCILQF